MPVNRRRRLRPTDTRVYRNGTTKTLVVPNSFDQNDLTRLEAAIAATYAVEFAKQARGAAVRTAKVHACSAAYVSSIVKKPKVSQVVDAHFNNVIDKIDCTLEDIVAEFCRIAFFNPQDLLDGDGCLMPMCDWPEHAARAIQGFDVERRSGEDEDVTVLKPRPASKVEALKALLLIKAPYLRDGGSKVPGGALSAPPIVNINFVSVKNGPNSSNATRATETTN